jgi:hypothetical protein
VGTFFFLLALAVRAAGRLDGTLTTAGLAIRYIGLATVTFLGMGILAPLLRRRWAAASYAALFGVAFAAMVVSLLDDVGNEWIAIASVFTAPLAAIFFADDIRRGADILCADSHSPEGAS